MGTRNHPMRIGYLITMLLFLILIFYFFIGLWISSPSLIQDIKNSVKSSITNQDTDIDNMEELEIEEATPTKIASFSDQLSNIFSKTESLINEAVPSRMALIDWNGLTQRVLGKRMVPEPNENNTVYLMNNGQLTYTYPDIGVKIAHKNFSVLNKYLKSVGTKLLYVQAPYKVDKNNNQMPFKLTDYPNQNADKLLEGLRKLKIDTIDFRDVLDKNFLDYKSLFYNTDHHWKTETAFFAYQYLLDYMKSNYGFNFNEKMVQNNNFTLVNQKKSFIGSLANRVGKWYAGVDDFTFLYPSFNTKLTYMKFDANGALYLLRHGSFEETVFYPERMDNPETPLAYRDNCYLGGNPDLGRIINHKVHTGKILFVQDSFGKPISSFMALNFHQVDIIDLRYFTESYLLDFIKDETTPYDYVVILYNPSALKRSTYYKQFRFYDYE